MPPVPTHTRRWFRFGHQMAVARIVICVVGIALPYAARIPGAIAYGPDWFNSYLPSSWSAFLLIGKFNAICWGSVLLATLTYRNALSVLFPAAFGFAFAFWGNAMLDLASDAQAAIAIIFIPIYALPFVCVGWAIGFVFDRQKGRRKFQFGLVRCWWR